MRKFSLKNEYGETYPLMAEDMFFNRPSGLGYSDNISYMNAGNVFMPSEISPVQNVISGTLIFKPPYQYEKYFEFACWVQKSEKLFLCYRPADEPYFIDVDLTMLEKGEISEFNLLEIPVAFTCRSFWYSDHNLNIIIDGEHTANIKQYSYRYPYRYANTSKDGAVVFTLNAQLSSGFTLSIKGPVSNPVVTVTDLSADKVLGIVDLSAMSAKENETLKFCTVADEAGAWLIKDNEITELTQYLGIRADIPSFFDIPPNIPVEFSIRAQSYKGFEANLKLTRYFRAV